MSILQKGSPRSRRFGVPVPGIEELCGRWGGLFKKNRLHIELYTEFKSAELEERVEAVLDRHGIFYAKSEVWIESERLYEVLYGMEV